MRPDRTAAPDPTPGAGRRARRPGPARRRGAVAAAAVVAVAAVGATGVAVAARGRAAGPSGSGSGTGAVATGTATVETRDLVVSEDLAGELGFGDPRPVAAGRDGVVTAVPAAGTAVGVGAAVFHLDLRPTILLRGAVPAFRDLETGGDPGADVAQLERALVDLGHGAGVTVDDRFTAATAAAVQRWEAALGRPDPDGVVERGDVLFAPGDLRVAEVTAPAGTQVAAGEAVAQVTGTTRVVTLGLTGGEAAALEVGVPVGVRLPDGSEAAGTVAAVATEPASSSGSGAGSGGGGGSEGEGGEGGEGGGSSVYPATVTLDDPGAAAGVDRGAVEVTVERSRVEDATAVPVTALLARTEGGYALQVVDAAEPDGHRYVPVEVGAVTLDWAQVTGDDIEAGVEVVVPV
jgi:hypothetical protein